LKVIVLQVTLLGPAAGIVVGHARQPESLLKNAGMETFRPQPASGRVYAARRVVRSTDVIPSGRLRLDALARYLQTAAEDDLADSGLAEPVVWLVRRCELRIRALPAMGERLTIATSCSGTGPRWAERTTTLCGSDGTQFVHASAVWAAVSRADGRPVPLSAAFLTAYGESAGGRVVSARLAHPRPASTVESGNGAGIKPPSTAWPLRAVDFDTAGHVNNAVHWAAVEEELAGGSWVPSVAEIEYHRAILPGCVPELVRDRREGETLIWLLDSGRVLASARLSR
jgi:acyl-ACP thioesterase